MRESRRVVLCVLAVVPLVAVTEALAGAMFGALLGTLLFPLVGTLIGLVLGGGVGALTGWAMGVVCALVLAPYFAAYSGGVRESGRGRATFALGAAALCAAAAAALLIVDWAMQPYFPHYEELLPFRLALGWLRQLDPIHAMAEEPPPPEDPGGAAIIETFLFLFASLGAAVAGALAARVATVSTPEDGGAGTGP